MECGHAAALPPRHSSAILGRMETKKGLFDSPDAKAEAESEARAEADVETGRVISHKAVRRWLQSWGSAKPLPRPRAGD